MSNKMNPRERITGKDVQNITGFKRAKAFSYYRAIKVAKQKRAALAADRRNNSIQAAESFVTVDDLAEYAGLSREAVKAGLVD